MAVTYAALRILTNTLSKQTKSKKSFGIMEFQVL